MFNSHIFSRFLRLVRSIRRSLFAFFVAIAILLATFVIAPTYALSAGESATSTEKAEGAKAGSTKNDGESNKQSEQSESNNTTEPNKKNTDTSSTLNKDNKESQSVKRQKSDSNNGVDKAKLAETAVKKSVKKKDIDSAEAVKGTDRGANEKPELPEACKNNRRYNTPEKCYSITYGNKTINIKSKNGEPYNRVPQILTPTIKVAGKVQQTLPAGVWLGLEKYSGNNDSVKYAFFKGENDSYTAKSTKNSDGSIRFFASKWLVANTYRFYVVIHYPGGSKSSTRIKAIFAKDDLPKAQPDDLSLSLYDFGNAQDGVAVSGNKIIIKPKSKGSTPSVGTVVSDDNKDVYDPINKLFIESKSTDKPGSIYHRMICHENGSDNYTSDRVNDLSLVTQTQFKHMENQNRPDKNAENSAVYENDDYTERSQSWISGTPKEAGTFECKVFAIKDVDLKQDLSTHKKPQSSKLAEEFGKRVKTNTDMKLLFDNPERNIVEDKWDNKTSIAKGVDWDYKTVIIQFGDKPKPKISDNDLTLKVYPFKTSDGSLPAALSSSNNNISAILGMSLKPFVDATSAADSTNKITLRVLCSKGEKKNKSLEYNTWSRNLDELGLSVPGDKDQTRCNKAGKGDNECTADKIASQASMEVSIKPTKVGDYSCVVYALKPEALNKFDALTGTLTPDSIKSALTSATPTAFKEKKEFAAFTFNIHLASNFTLPNTGGQSWNLQFGILAALLVNLLAAGFVVSQSECARKLIFGRRRGLCNHV
ncbi:hypothetical protein [Bifidobacteriaceae bacterium WP021]|uniref:hypothetical protein n=1 Tax=Gardnerella sp. DNF01151 TaxID=2749059 RepID=UPI000E696F0F|nr:hypothetical protein CJI51_04080 [Bifidobacteriaceae bacterium WP021]